MRVLLIVGGLFILGMAASFGAANFSHLAANVVAMHGILTVACWILFLLHLAVVIIASTDRAGRLREPRSLSLLLCWALLIPQAGFAAGRLVNYQSSLAMMLAVGGSPGVEIQELDGVAVLDGVIGPRTFTSLVDMHERRGVSLLRLRSGGGSIDAAEKIGRFLAEKGIATWVEGNCESACVIVALSGAGLHVAPRARFGFHRGSAAASPDSELGRYHGNRATDRLIVLLKELGVPEKILRQTEETPPDGMYYVSGSDLHRFGLARHLIK